MQALPLVSFLMPTYNRADRIALAIVTVLKQTYQNVEVIVYDDGSDDDTQDVIRDLKDTRIKYYRAPLNGGVAKARNALLDLAKGEYACWLDSDDRANIYRAEISVAAMERYKPSYIRTAQTTFGKPTDKSWKRAPILVWKGGICFGSICFRPSIAPRFDERFTCCFEDMDWEIQCARKNGHGLMIPLTLYGIGRRAPLRMTMRYKDPEHVVNFKASSKLFSHKCKVAVAEIKASGKTKMPDYVSWEFLQQYLGKFYGKFYSTALSG